MPLVLTKKIIPFPASPVVAVLKVLEFLNLVPCIHGYTKLPRKILLFQLTKL